jgi:hypothetical protein
MNSGSESNPATHSAAEGVQLPSPTAWPALLALGVALLAAGLVTNSYVSLVGALLAFVGGIGWFR